MASADSSAHALDAKQQGQGRGRGAPGARRASTGRTLRDTLSKSSTDSSRRLAQARVGALDRPGYIGGKLDLDVATAAQMDSLPGVTPTMAKRIAADRMRNGPFLNAERLRRVTGVGDKFLREIDTLVIFSGTLKAASGSDSLIEKPKKQKSPRGAKSRRPVAQRSSGPNHGDDERQDGSDKIW
ncbi:MAG: helix-hairpin-helix domain-containing protein [Gemmatimonadaceae bacterium]